MDEVLFEKNNVKLTADGWNVYLHGPAPSNGVGEPFQFEKVMVDTPENRAMMMKKSEEMAG